MWLFLTPTYHLIPLQQVVWKKLARQLSLPKISRCSGLFHFVPSIFAPWHGFSRGADKPHEKTPTPRAESVARPHCLFMIPNSESRFNTARCLRVYYYNYIIYRLSSCIDVTVHFISRIVILRKFQTMRLTLKSLELCYFQVVKAMIFTHWLQVTKPVKSTGHPGRSRNGSASTSCCKGQRWGNGNGPAVERNPMKKVSKNYQTQCQESCWHQKKWQNLDAPTALTGDVTPILADKGVQPMFLAAGGSLKYLPIAPMSTLGREWWAPLDLHALEAVLNVFVQYM